VSTAPKMKPVKVAGKQRTPAQTASGETDNASTAASTRSIFEQALCAAQELLLGELENKTRACEISTREAIREAQVTEKLSAYRSGFNRWREMLSTSATKYCEDCVDFALNDRAGYDAFLSLARISSADELRSPAGFAKGLTEVEISRS
jgi:hypothetical protein